MQPAKSIGIVSGKGGVGKTTLTANIGVALARDFGMNVVVVDANVLTSNLGLHLGFIREPVSLHDVLHNKLKVEQVVYVHSSGLSVIPSSLKVDSKINASALNRVIDHLKTQYDLVLVDSAPGLSTEALAVMNACDGFIIVANPDLPSVTDSLKTIDIIEKKNKHVLGIVLNKVTGKSYELLKAHVERVTDNQVISEIPYDESVPASIAAKIPVVMFRPNSRAAIEFKKIAAWLCDKPYNPTTESLWTRIFRMIFG